MRPTSEQFQVESNLGGNAIAMGIDQESMAHIMGVLTDLYSDKVLAVLREYSTNAHDAHTEIGVTRPIEVTLPGDFAPFLRIKDFGVGLTEDDITRVYSQYGASTKRETNTQNGMLGLGCKSALTYCSQFTVTSVHGGQKIAVNIGRDEEGGGFMTVVDKFPSDEPSGTEVTVPVRRADLAAYKSTARDFYKYWEPGTVLVNGVEPERFAGLKLTEGIYIENDGQGDNVIVMGNVAYPAPGLAATKVLSYRSSVTAFVPIGAVNFTPSREALMDTKRTRETVADLLARVEKAVVGAIQRDVDAAATPHEALLAKVAWNDRLRNHAQTVAYRGVKIPNEVVDDNGCDFLLSARRGGYYGGKLFSFWRELAVTEYVARAVWIEDFHPKALATAHRDKVAKWLGAEVALPSIIACRGKVPSDLRPFLAPQNIVSYETIKAVKLNAAAPRSPSSTAGFYKVVTEAGAGTCAPDKIRSDAPVFYVEGYVLSHMLRVIQLLHPRFTVVVLQPRRVAKFLRLRPEATKLADAHAAGEAAWIASLSDEDKVRLAMPVNIQRLLLRFDAGRIDDPVLRGAIESARISVSKRDADLAREFRLPKGPSDPFADYPLFCYAGYGATGMGILSDDPDHIYTYINAAYAARQRPEAS